MKQFLFTLAILATTSVFAQTDIKFKEQTHKFGKIKKGFPLPILLPIPTPQKNP